MPTLGYWDIRGLAEPIRLMLEHAGQSYDQEKYLAGPAPTYDRSQWLDKKEKMGLDFPNLPYYMDGDVKMTESWAIMRHVARKNNLLPDDNSAHLCDQAQGVISDFRMSFVMMCYRDGFAENKKNFFAALPAKLTRFDDYLGKNKWMSGEKLTYVDFAFCEILDQLQLMEKSVYDKYANVKEYLKNFMAQPNIAKYRSSDRFKKFPCNGAMAKWGGGQSEE